jgi:benzoyl-CoA reductase subunit B
VLHEPQPADARATCSNATCASTQADGFLINSVKSCNSFSAGQLMILREVEKRTGVPGGFIESDLVDPRYFSAANIKNRLESYFQMIEQKRGGGA